MIDQAIRETKPPTLSSRIFTMMKLQALAFLGIGVLVTVCWALLKGYTLALTALGVVNASLWAMIPFFLTSIIIAGICLGIWVHNDDKKRAAENKELIQQ